MARKDQTDEQVEANTETAGDETVPEVPAAEAPATPKVRQAWTDEQKQNMSEKMKAYWAEHEHPLKGKPMSDEAKEALRQKLKDYYAQEGVTGPMTGRPVSDETREKIRQSHLARSARIKEQEAAAKATESPESTPAS
jgi:hypothetical protein